ncbi:UNVERIFIED_CONTAM: hypothetical protein PYX00_006286 [Menopon gallinae]|uniref:Uncharacterized protein n=1 Tax=Menopon gallinae TaxID=328185 RepID=A0AAW2HV95_9NEOP
MLINHHDGLRQRNVPWEQRESNGEKSMDFICELCRRDINDPRLMPCLHSFCLECLRLLESETLQKTSSTRSSSNQSQDTVKKKWTDMVMCAGKTSDKSGVSNSAYEATEEGRKKKILKCPTCGFNNVLPDRGVIALPHNHLLQHRLLLSKLNRSDVRLLCDLCQHEVVAHSRCTKCLLNLCGACSTAHKMDTAADHEIIALKSEHSASTITKIRRQAMCPAHPQNDIKFFCQSCNQMTCKKCSLTQHRDHSCGLLSKAARVYRRKIKEVLDQTVYIVRETESVKSHSESVFQQLLSNCMVVKNDIDTYINSYIEALEEHRKGLKFQVEQTRNTELQLLKQQLMEVEKRQRESNYALKFGEDLLAEGSDFEVISLASPLLRRLEWIIQSGPIKSRVASNSAKLLQFLRDERAGTIKNHSVFGVLTNQIVSPMHSSLTIEGLNALKNCTQKQQCQVKLVTRDSNNKPVTHGAENIDMDLRYIESNSQRQVPILATDRQDGTYLIIFTPDQPGNLKLSITIRGHPIKGSPFSVHVRKPRVHRGVFHCCTFCSSGGSKKASCGCGGKMPGGYLGCGHGHVGHPGKRHWSCCGNTFPNSECVRKPSGVYLLTF